MNEVIQRLARECAEKLITVIPYESEDGDYWICIGKSPTQSGEAHLYTSESDADYDREIYINNSIPFIADTLSQYDRTLPVESPVSEERLRDIWSEAGIINNREATARYNDLKKHIEHLTHLVKCMSAESEGLAFAEGIEMGKRMAGSPQ